MENNNSMSHVEENLIPAAAPLLAGIADKLGVLKKLSAVTEKAKALGVKLGVGGVTQDRFLNRRDAIADLFNSAGYYKANGRKPVATMAKYNIVAADIPNRKTSSYKEEYHRLYKWVVAVLNEGNPGLGDLYASYFSDFPMYNGGSMVAEPYEGLKIFLSTFPAGTYKPGQLPDLKNNPAQVVATSLAPQQLPPDPTLPAPGPSMAGINLDLASPLFLVAIVVVLILVFSKLKT